MSKLDSEAADEEFTPLDALMLIVNFGALIVSSFKVLALLRMFNRIASLIELLSNSFRDIKAFLLYFFFIRLTFFLL